MSGIKRDLADPMLRLDPDAPAAGADDTDPDLPIPFQLAEDLRCVRTGCPRPRKDACPVGYCGYHCADEIRLGHFHRRAS